MNDKILFAAALLVTFLATVLISKKLIPILKSRKMGQTILEIGPRWHKNKEGTPMMGGLAFIAASGIIFCVASGLSSGFFLVFLLCCFIVIIVIVIISDCYDWFRSHNRHCLYDDLDFFAYISRSDCYCGLSFTNRCDQTFLVYFGNCISFGLICYLRLF